MNGPMLVLHTSGIITLVISIVMNNIKSQYVCKAMRDVKINEENNVSGKI